MQISVPANFDLRIIHRFKHRIADTYGSLNNGSVLATFPPAYLLPVISIDKLKRYVEYSHLCGVKFNYILSHPELKIDKNVILLLESLNKIKVDILTISNPDLISFVRNNYPFEISSSIVCKIDSLELASFYKNLGCDIICLDYSRNNDISFIKTLKDQLKVKVKLLANNCCFINCPYEQEHYAKKVSFEKTSFRCLKLKLKDDEFIQRTGFIHPIDLALYENAGVDIIKLGGRSRSSAWIINCVQAYLNKDYKGNSFLIMNTIGSENRPLGMLAYLFLLFPDLVNKIILRCLYVITGKRVLRILAKEKRLKPLIRFYLGFQGYIYMDYKKAIFIAKKKEYLIRQIEDICTESPKERLKNT